MPQLLKPKIILLLILLTLLDLSFFPYLAGGVVRPVIAYLFVVHTAYEWHWQKILPAAFLVGLIRDLIAFQWIGVETISLVLASFVLTVFVRKIEAGAMIFRMVASFLFTVLALFFSGILISFFRRTWFLSGQGFMNLFSSAAATAVLLPVFAWLIGRWLKKEFRYSPFQT